MSTTAAAGAGSVRTVDSPAVTSGPARFAASLNRQASSRGEARSELHLERGPLAPAPRVRRQRRPRQRHVLDHCRGPLESAGRRPQTVGRRCPSRGAEQIMIHPVRRRCSWCSWWRIPGAGSANGTAMSGRPPRGAGPVPRRSVRREARGTGRPSSPARARRAHGGGCRYRPRRRAIRR